MQPSRNASPSLSWIRGSHGALCGVREVRSRASALAALSTGRVNPLFQPTGRDSAFSLFEVTSPDVTCTHMAEESRLKTARHDDVSHRLSAGPVSPELIFSFLEPRFCRSLPPPCPPRILLPPSSGAFQDAPCRASAVGSCRRGCRRVSEAAGHQFDHPDQE